MSSFISQFRHLGEVVNAHRLDDEGIIILSYPEGMRPVTQLSSDEFNTMVSNAELVSISGHAEERVQTLMLDDFRATTRVSRISAYLDYLKQFSSPCSLKSRQRSIRHVSRQLDDPNPPSPSTLYQWYKKDQASGLGRGPTFAVRTQPNRGSYCPQGVTDLAFSVFDDHFLKLNGASVSACYDHFKKQFNELKATKAEGFDGSCPSQATFYRWNKQMIPAVDAVVARQGASAGRAYRRNVMRRFGVEDILDRVEIDAVTINVGLKDELGTFYGPVTLYAAIDVYSRMIVGYHLQLGQGESASAYIHCLQHALMPKPDQEELDTLNRWPAYGVPGTIAADPSAAIQSLNFQTFVHHLKSTLIIVQAGQGWKKPFIERWFNTLRTRFLSTLPGYAGKRTDQNRASIDMKKHATLTVEEFKTMLDQYIVDEYHQRPHSGLNGQTPHHVWTARLAEMPVVIPHAIENLKYLMGETLQRVCSHEGIRIHNVFYHSGELSQIFNEIHDKKHKFTVHYDTEDVGRIVVLTPDGRTLVVPAVDFELLNGMSLSQLRSTRSVAKRQLKVDEDQVNISDSDLFRQVWARHTEEQAAQAKKKPKRPQARQELVNETAENKAIAMEGLEARNQSIDQGLDPFSIFDDEIEGEFEIG